MMPLFAQREVSDLAELLKGVEDKIKQVVEMHPSEDSDCHYVFVVWLNKPDDDAVEVKAMIQANCRRRAQDECDWEDSVYNFGGLILIDSRL